MKTRTIQTIPEQIADQLRKDILSRTFKEDEPLREHELSDRFGVSRGPVRAALQQLEMEGLVVALPNVGVRVAPHPTDDVRPLIIHMRRSIEAFTLDKVFDQVTNSIIGHLEDTLEKLRTACKQGNIHALHEHDRTFHSTLVELYGERRLFTLWHTMFTWMIFQYGRHENLMESYREHKEILNAIKTGEKEKALELLTGNIQ